MHSRRRRIPYKRIAAQLGKSELACRLHYHQVTVARQRSSPPVADSIPAIEFDPSPPLVHRASSPNTPALSQDRLLKPTPVQPLPSLSSLLPVDFGHHRRSKSLPPPLGHCSCASCLHMEGERKPMLPPPAHLLSPFDPSRQLSCGVNHDALQDMSTSHAISYRLPHITNLRNSPEPLPWTPSSSRSSSLSSFGSIFPVHTSPGCGNHHMWNDRCSVQSIMNQNIPSTI